MNVLAYIRISASNQEVPRLTTKIHEFCQTGNMTIVDTMTDFGKWGAALNRVAVLRHVTL